MIFLFSGVILLLKEGRLGWLAVSVFLWRGIIGKNIATIVGGTWIFWGDKWSCFPHTNPIPPCAGWFTGYSTTHICGSTTRQLPSNVHAARSSLGASTIVSYFWFKKSWNGNGWWEVSCGLPRIDFLEINIDWKMKKWRNENFPWSEENKRDSTQCICNATFLDLCCKSLMSEHFLMFFHRGTN